MSALALALEAAGYVSPADRLVSIATEVCRLPEGEWIAAAIEICPDHDAERQKRRLMQVATEAIKQAGPRNWDGGRDLFYQKIRNDPALLWELFAPYRQQAVHMLLTAANQELREMERQQRAVVSSARGQVAGANLGEPAPRATSLGGQPTRDSQSQPAPQPGAAANDRARSTAAAKAAIAQKSVLDTFVINGQPIGKLTAGEARRWAGAHRFKVRFVELLTANLPSDEPIGKFVRADEAEQLFKRAQSEMSDAS